MNMNTTKYIAVMYLSALVVLTGCKEEKPANDAEKAIASARNLRKTFNWPRQKYFLLKKPLPLPEKWKVIQIRRFPL